MKTRSILFLGSLLIMVMLALVAYVLVPPNSWSTTAIVAYTVLVASVGLTLHPTFGLPDSNESGDAPTFAAIGPIAVFFGFQLVWNSSSFAMALSGYDRMAIAMIIITVFSFVLMTLYMKVGAKLVGDVQEVSRKDSMKIGWRNKIRYLAGSTNDEMTKALLTRLSERIEYSASDNGSLTEKEDLQLNVMIDELIKNVGAYEFSIAEEKVCQIENALMFRDCKLLSSRSKT